MKCFLCMHGEIYSPKTLYKIKKLKKIIYKDKDIDSEDFKKRYSYLLKKLGDGDTQIIWINLLIKQEKNDRKEKK
ncbi:hypothetical protein [Spiroplasma endosymbiont of Amphimallon solstitiale]|uniref:hypothetical protein n=1 Tax=Spiroplasma endosymbiont of Amphimallon solstitiale TaxID=3066288 RepID=UPI00313D4D48